MKVKKIFLNAVLSVLFIFVSYVMYCSIFNIYKPLEKLNAFVIILGIIVLIFIFIYLKKLIRGISERKANTIAVLLCIVFFIALLIFAFSLVTIPVWDLSDVVREAMLMVKNNGEFINEQYFSVYNNQVPVTIFIYFIFKLGELLRFENLHYFAIGIHCLLLTITAFFTYLSVKKIKDHKVALLTLVFFIINPIFYIESSYYYTDTLCMPFAAIAFYLFVSAIKTQSNKKAFLLLTISGLILAMGCKIRVVLGILLIGMIISLWLNNKFGKKYIINSISLVSGVGIGIILCSVIALLFSIPQNEKLKFPPIHWVMMSFNEKSDGYYTQNDYLYTYNSGNYKEKNKADMEMLQTRLNKMGISGLISLSKTKLSVNWSNGNYDSYKNFWGIEECGNLYEYVVGNKKVFITYLCQIFKATIMLVFAIMIVKCYFNKEYQRNYNVVLLSVFGAFVFYLFWEVKSRYSLAFLPWMMIIFGSGINEIENLLNIHDITIKIKENKTRNIAFTKLKKVLIVFICGCSLFMIAENYREYTKIRTFTDNRVNQQNVRESKINKIANKTIIQTFKTSKTFNRINIKFIKEEEPKKMTNYNMFLRNSKKEVISEQKFTSEDVINNRYKTFEFENVIPNGMEEYKIEICSADATEKNSIGLKSYYFEDYDIYPDGELTINGKAISADLTFNVQYKNKRSYISRSKYILMGISIILLEILAFFPEFKRKI